MCVSCCACTLTPRAQRIDRGVVLPHARPATNGRNDGPDVDDVLLCLLEAVHSVKRHRIKEALERNITALSKRTLTEL